ncbi:MAG: SAM-dependent methyltransferase [Flavobacteriales bacterium]|nr:SAM-dependent methyltransferase [Flavobacteriales bacterium]
MNGIPDFLKQLSDSFTNGSFVKVTLSKPAYKSDGLLNVYVRPIELQGTAQLSFTYHFQSKDEVKNYGLKSAQEELNKQLHAKFRHAVLMTTEADWSLQLTKKGKASIKKLQPSIQEVPSVQHDKPKTKKAAGGKYLQLLGVCDEQGKVIPKMADKYKQINNYLEIFEGLLKNAKLPKQPKVVDMGSGKGYLTFALYDYLVNQLGLEATITGIELRKELVDFCNKTAKACGFENLHFIALPIDEYAEKVDVLIALHACDTATDDAIYKGLAAHAQLIVTAPCCHKQVRKQLKGIEQQSPILKYGIYKERQYEMLTDTIRALLMEKEGYNTNIFEFISNEHTRKNVMLVGVKSNKKPDTDALNQKLKDLKSEFGVEEQYLEQLIG